MTHDEGVLSRNGSDVVWYPALARGMRHALYRHLADTGDCVSIFRAPPKSGSAARAAKPDDEHTNTKIRHGVTSRRHLLLCWGHERSRLTLLIRAPSRAGGEAVF